MIILQIIAIIGVLTKAPLSSAKVYKKCELARELSEIHGVSSEDLATYVCIAERQSNFNTQAVGQGTYGLFQMSSEFWCDTDYSHGKACDLNCDDLIDDNLSDDLQCVRTIIDEHERISGNGFDAWPSGTSCQLIGSNYLAECEIASNQVFSSHRKLSEQQQGNDGGKVYERCELAKELRYQHNIPMEEIATWVCIAKHESSFNTSAIGRLNWDGSEDHGLFQISDIYWCGDGKGCGLSCEELRDNDITNDVKCIQIIHEEHTRLFGDGFQAWAVYPRCKGQSDSYIDGCFESDNEIVPFKPKPGVQQPKVQKSKISIRVGSAEEGKVYEKCELARELRDIHNFPINQIATWVCIAKHESNFNTSAIGRLNWDGSEDHGLFQISDIYWCGSNGKACNAQCSEFRDSDISNDVECVKKIHEEHTRLSGDGFNAWAVYPRCKGKSKDFIKGCFDDSSNEILPFKPMPGIQQHQGKNSYEKINRRVSEKVIERGKIYDRCELAQELRFKYKIPMEQVATWVCIAKQESNYDTSAIGRLNADKSEDHGIFQISDLYRCSKEGQGKGCDLACSELEDSDISNDVECMLKIHEEHTYLSGDGFNAWTTYSRCKGQSDEYIRGCFNDNENSIQNVRPGIFQPATHHPINRVYTTTELLTTINEITTTETTPPETTTTTTLPKTTTIFHQKASSTSKVVQKSITQKPFNSFFNSLQKSNSDSKQEQQQQKKNNGNNKPTSSPLYKSFSTNKPAINKEINSQKNLQSLKVTSSSSLSAAKSTLRILQTTTPKNIKSSNVINLKSSTRKSAPLPTFDIFAFYLNDYTSKRPSINYKPIEFDSKKSTVIIANKSNNLRVQSAQQQKQGAKSSTASSFGETPKTTTQRSLFNLPSNNYVDDRNSVNKNRFGRVVGNITPHSIDYLLKLTTPRTFYG